MSELDDLLKSLREEQPRPADIARWKLALRQMHQRQPSRWVELVAAMLVGVVIGGTLFHKEANDEISNDHATIERVITKIE